MLHLFGIGSVSYTHLDVYKRQHLRGCVRDALETGGGDVEAKIDELLRVLDKLDKQ